jgi:hypothetical protein
MFVYEGGSHMVLGDESLACGSFSSVTMQMFGKNGGATTSMPPASPRPAL